MWVDPIELSAIRDENIREAKRRGITLEALLKEQRDKREIFCSKDRPTTPYPKYEENQGIQENYEYALSLKQKIKNKIVNFLLDIRK